MTKTVLIAAAAFSLVSYPAGDAGNRTGQLAEARLLVRLPAEAEADSVILQNPVGATRFADGSIAVVDGLARTVLFFDPDGRFTGSAGRAGEGPNEFSTPGWMGRCADDQATVWDFSLMRFTTVDATGRITAQDRMQDRFDVPRPPSLVGCSRTGHLAFMLRLSGERIRGREISVLTAPLYAVRRGGEATLLLDAVPVIEWLNEERTYRPVSMTTHFAISDSLVYVTRSDSTTVHAYDLAGNLRNTFALELPRRAPTDTHVRRDGERHTASISDRVTRAGIIEQFMQHPRPEFLPSHSGIHLGPAGRLWVVTSVPGDSTTVLRAFDLRGGPLGGVRIPAELRVLEVGEDYVLGSFQDASTLEPGIAVYAFSLPG